MSFTIALPICHPSIAFPCGSVSDELLAYRWCT